MLQMQEAPQPAQPPVAAAAVTWRDRAVCKQLPTRIFFPEKGRNDWMLATAYSICAACPVRTDCLLHALKNEPIGVWGGHTELARRNIRTKARTQGGTYENQILALAGRSHHTMNRVADYVRIDQLLPGQATVDHHGRRHQIVNVVPVDDDQVAVSWHRGRWVTLPASLHVYRWKPTKTE